MNCRQTLKSFFLVLLLSATTCLPAWAQTAPSSSFADLRSGTIFKKGETVEITDEHGQRLRARVAALTAQTFTVTVNGKRRELSESQVLEIRREKPDSVMNGILIGIGAGVAGGLIMTSATCPNDPECAANAGPILFLISVGGGIAIGGLIDSSIHSMQTVFERRRPLSSISMHASPIVNKQTKGVKVAFRF